MAKKYYGIWLDEKNTVVDSWAECQKQTKGVPGVEFRGFELRADAENFRGYSRDSSPSVATKAPPRMTVSFLTEKPDISLEIKQDQAVQLPQKLPYEVTIFTDGSCFNKSGSGQTQEAGRLYPGGYAAVFLDMNQNELMRIKGGEQYTTNNRMELTAVKEALQYLDDGTRHKVHIVSDSQYVVNSFSKHWVQGWKRSGLKTGDEIIWRKGGTLEEVKNQELFKAVDILQSKHDVDFSYTRAHVGTKTRESFYNDLCDTLAKTMSEEMSRRKNSNTVTIANSKPSIVRSAMRESVEHVR